MCRVGFPGGTSGKEPPASSGDIRDAVGSLGQEDCLERHGHPLQYSCLENPMDRGAWQATVHGVRKSQARLTRLSAHSTCADIHFSSTSICTSACSVIHLIETGEHSVSVHSFLSLFFFFNSHILVVVPCQEAPSFMSPLLMDI